MSNSESLPKTRFSYREDQRMCIRVRWFRKRIFETLNGIQGASIHIEDMAGKVVLGDGNAPDDWTVNVKVHDIHFYSAISLGGSIAAAESFMRGDWSCSDLTTLFRILIRNKDIMDGLDSGMARISQSLYSVAHRLRRNTLRGSKRNIASHYDLSNEFFALFLDPTMTYSSGIFLNDESTMEEASIEKLDRICRELNLTPEDHILEIGCGWGSFAIHAAKHYGCQVTATTISDQQYKLAKQRIQEFGLAERITLLKQDYRTLQGAYDKIVSIEMIEAVGHEYLPTFFRKCNDLLKQDGIMALQAIVIDDRQYDSYRQNADFINRYIFPGGCLPSNSHLCNVMTQTSRLAILEQIDITFHYAETLRRWHDKFLAELANVRKLGFDNRFILMWTYYLCYCEAGFIEKNTACMQAILKKC